MRIVVIGGQARKVGKTSVMAGLIRKLRRFKWTAVKISRHDGRIPHLSGPPSGRASRKRGFVLTEERIASNATDTGRYLAAGAKRALWLRVETGRFEEATSALVEKLAGEQNVMIESSSALSLLAPDVGIVVVDGSRREVKPNISRAMRYADAVVVVESSNEPVREARQFSSGARRFRVTRKDYFNSELCRFVRWKLRGKTVW